VIVRLVTCSQGLPQAGYRQRGSPCSGHSIASTGLVTYRALRLARWYRRCCELLAIKHSPEWTGGTSNGIALVNKSNVVDRFPIGITKNTANICGAGFACAGVPN
jgi:hypothetical protein